VEIALLVLGDPVVNPLLSLGKGHVSKI
jgi:hypothetical protein